MLTLLAEMVGLVVVLVANRGSLQVALVTRLTQVHHKVIMGVIAFTLAQIMVVEVVVEQEQMG
jgi:hypothetical protein